MADLYKLSYKQRLDLWEMKYGHHKVVVHLGEGKRPFRTEKFKRASLKYCQKCGSVWRIARHHKGYESIFATFWEEKYAPRYIQFKEEDIVRLCLRCHKKIHKLYLPILEELQWEISEILEMKPPMRLKKLEVYRNLFVKKCNQWLKRKVSPPSPATKRRVSKSGWLS